MRKKLIFLSLFISMGINSFSLTVYDPANHQTNMQQYQTNILQKIEQVKTATDTAKQVTYDLQNLKDNATNLEQWTGTLLGEESQALLKAIDDLNQINANTQAVLRNSREIEKDFDNFYLPTDELKNLDSTELYNEITKLARNRRYALKDNLKTATSVIEMNTKDRNSSASFMGTTDGARGQLQSAMATKKGIDQLNNKIARSLDLQAKQLLAMSQAEADRQMLEDLEREQARLMFEISEETKKDVEKMRKTGKIW